jgi:hypothetical protein
MRSESGGDRSLAPHIPFGQSVGEAGIGASMNGSTNR